MRRSGIAALLTIFLTLASGSASSAAESRTNAAEPADFKEVYDALRAHLSGVSEEELNRAAVEGLISALGAKVSLETNSAAQKGTNAQALVSGSSVLESNIAYLRVVRVGE